MNIREIVLAKIKEVGADGLMNRDNCCGCRTERINKCNYSNLFDCELATAALKASYCRPEDCAHCSLGCSGYLEACADNSVLYVPRR